MKNNREELIAEIQQLQALARRLSENLPDFSEDETAALSAALQDFTPLFRKFRTPNLNTGKLIDRSSQEHMETELKRLLGENRRYAALLEAIFAADPGGLAVVAGPDLSFAFANPAYRYICPNLGQDITGQPYETIWPAGSGKGFHEQIRAVLETGRPFQVPEFEREYPDGTRRFFTFQARRIEWGSEQAALLIFWDTTDLIHSQRQLVRLLDETYHQGEVMQGLFNAMSDAVLIFDPQGVVLNANPALIQTIGFDPTGKRREEITANLAIRWPDGRELGADQLPSVRSLRGEKVAGERIRLETGSGKTYFLDVTASPLYGAEGQVMGVLVVWRDITERIETEQLAAAQQEWLKTTLSSIGDAVITSDASGQVAFLNPVAEQLTGWKSAEAVSQPLEQVFRIINEQTRQPVEAPVKKVLESGTVVGLANHTTLISRDGREIPIEDSAAPIVDRSRSVDESGNILGVVMIFRDVTEKRKAEQALQESRMLLQLVVEEAPDAIFLKDKNSRVLLANSATLQIIGKPAEQVIGKNDAEFYDDPEVGRSIMENDRRVMESGQTQVIEERVIRPGEPAESEKVYLSTKTPYRNAVGEVIGIIGVAREITSIKTRERELNKLNRTLKALNKSNQAMMRASNEQNFMQEVCRIVTEDCGYAMVWIGLAEQDEAKTVRPVAYAGYEDGYLEKLHITWADSERGRGPTGTAIRTGQPATCRNMLTDPLFAPWREEAQKRGYASSLVLPMLDAGEVFGAITIYSREPDAFREDEVSLLNELASDLGYGISTMRARGDQARVEQALRESEERYRSLFQGMTEGFALHEVICDENGVPVDYRFLEVNPAFENLTGLKAVDLKGKLYSQIEQLREDGSRWVDVYGNVALTGEPVHFENYSPGLKRYYEVFAYRPAELQFAVIFMDITERRQTEFALRQAREVAEKSRTQIEVQRRLIEQREQERQRIARDLHDGPVQIITSATYTLQGLTMTNPDEQQVKELESVRASLQDVIGEMRAYAQELRPPVLFNFGLRRAIQSHLEGFQEKHPELHIQLEVDWTGDLLPEQLSIALFRVYQESLNNIIKHSRARQVWVNLARKENQVTMLVQDDGAGFILPADLSHLAREGHLGLVGIRERVEAIGGSLELSSEPGKGTKIQVQVPLG